MWRRSVLRRNERACETGARALDDLRGIRRGAALRADRHDPGRGAGGGADHPVRLFDGHLPVPKLSGAGHTVHNGGITDDDIQDGFILACCARPLGAVAVDA